jgi:chemotaxis response regulator CheB
MRVAIANDSPVIMQAMARVVARSPGMQIAWLAGNGRDAVRHCAEDRPDLLLMDLMMPEMTGMEATRQIMARTPCPILIVTATVESHSAMVFEALGAGALDVVKTPILGAYGDGPGEEALLEKIDLMGRLLTGRPVRPRQPFQPSAPRVQQPARGLVAIGASAGGPAAVGALLAALPVDFPACIVVVQHVDAQFASLLADWLHEQSAVPVRPAVAGEAPLAGTALLAATDDHLILTSRGRLAYTREPAAASYRPSVDIFFDSVAEHWRGAVVGVLLTGMGRDGAKGLKRLHESGALTIAQDQASCTVYGMPKAAADLGAASEILPLDEIAARLAFQFRPSHE